MPTEANTTLLSDKEVAEIESHFHLTTDGDAVFILSNAPALCATVKALRAENENLRVHVEERDSLLGVGIARVDPPAAPDERDKALAQQDEALVSTILRPVRGCATDSQYTDAFDRAMTALATVRAEVWRDAIAIAKAAAWTTKNHDVGAHELEECSTCAAALQSTEVAAALESARTGKVEG